MLRKIVSTFSALGVAGALAATIALGAPTPASAAATTDQPTVLLAQAAGKPEARALAGQALRKALVRATADLTGKEVTAVREAVRGGQSLAQIAAANGSSGDAVVQAVVEKARARLDQAVEKGRITRERADELLQKLTERATELVNKTREA